MLMSDTLDLSDFDDSFDIPENGESGDELSEENRALLDQLTEKSDNLIEDEDSPEELDQ